MAELPKLEAVPSLGYYPQQPVSCGTTLIAVECEGGVVLGTDSRTSVGSYISSRVTDKITPVTEKLFVCRSGSAADTQAITDIVKYYISVHEIGEKEKITVYRAAQIFRQFCYEYRDDMSASVIVAGYDEVEGAQLYAIPIGGFVVRQRCAASGSGSTFVNGFLDSQWKPGMSIAEAEEFVINAVALATMRDGSSGGVIRIGTLTKDGMQRK
uniref:Proteasome subunit beta n=1 Tax=Plectus sambesii TaxID=2011161 RepID=A0A914UZA1_9BILA